MREMTGGDAVYETLRALGVDTVFGIVSVHNIPIYDAIHRGGGITAVAVRHEQGAVHAADGYARATGKLGVAITSTGPGVTNGVTGLFEAGFASSRVMMICGQIDSVYYGKGKGFLHEAENQLPMLRTMTGRTESVRRPEEIGEAVFRVAQDINTGRPRPGAVEIPIDFQYAKAEIDIPHVEAWPRKAPDRDSISKAAEAIRNAKKVVIWAGGGVLTAGAEGELAQLAEALQAPVFTSGNGRGSLPEDHPLCMGPLTAQPGVGETLADADVVVAVGTRFQAGQTRNWTLPLGGKLIHIDADAWSHRPELQGRRAGRWRRAAGAGGAAQGPRRREERRRVPGPRARASRRDPEADPDARLGPTTRRSWTRCASCCRATASSCATRRCRPTSGATGSCRSLRRGPR